MKALWIMTLCAGVVFATPVFAQNSGGSEARIQNGADMNAWRRNDGYMQNRRSGESSLHYYGRQDNSRYDGRRGSRRGNAGWNGNGAHDHGASVNPNTGSGVSISNQPNIIIQNTINGQTNTSTSTSTPTTTTTVTP